jgi:hypothetical protein
MTSKLIQEVPRRDYQKVPYSGDLINKSGHVGMGGHLRTMQKEVLRLAKLQKAAGILSSLDVLAIMPKPVKEALVNRLKLLEQTPQPWNHKHVEVMDKLRRNLREETKQQEERNTQADQVIAIMHTLSARNVQIRMDRVQQPFGTESEKALIEIIRVQEVEFFAEPYLRRMQITDLVTEVGIAKTQTQVLLLAGTLDDIYDNTADWLVKSDIDGTKVLYEETTQAVGEKEKLRSLMVRISTESHALGTYRALVAHGLEDNDTFKAVVDKIRKKARTDIPSLDHISPQTLDSTSVSHQALVTRVNDDRDRVPEEHKEIEYHAFHAGFQSALASQAKRKQEEEPIQIAHRPYQQAPVVGISQSAPFRGPYQQEPVDKGQPETVLPKFSCIYWNGKECGFQEFHKRECGFSRFHRFGENTRIKDYVPKPKDVPMHFQDWKAQGGPHMSST